MPPTASSVPSSSAPPPLRPQMTRCRPIRIGNQGSRNCNPQRQEPRRHATRAPGLPKGLLLPHQQAPPLMPLQGSKRRRSPEEPSRSRPNQGSPPYTMSLGFLGEAELDSLV